MSNQLKAYKTEISVRCIGSAINDLKLHSDHPLAHFLHCIYRNVFPTDNIGKARQFSIDIVEEPVPLAFERILDYYSVPYKTLEWGDWQKKSEPEDKKHIHSCSSLPFSVGVFKWTVEISVYEVKRKYLYQTVH